MALVTGGRAYASASRTARRQMGEVAVAKAEIAAGTMMEYTAPQSIAWRYDL